MVIPIESIPQKIARKQPPQKIAEISYIIPNQIKIVGSATLGNETS